MLEPISTSSLHLLTISFTTPLSVMSLTRPSTQWFLLHCLFCSCFILWTYHFLLLTLLLFCVCLLLPFSFHGNNVIKKHKAQALPSTLIQFNHFHNHLATLPHLSLPLQPHPCNISQLQLEQQHLSDPHHLLSTHQKIMLPVTFFVVYFSYSCLLFFIIYLL